MTIRFGDSDFVPKPSEPDDAQELDEKVEMDESEVPMLGAFVGSQLKEIALDDVLQVLYMLGRPAARSAITRRIDRPAKDVLGRIDELMGEGKIEEFCVRIQSSDLDTDKFYQGVRISPQYYAQLKANDAEIEMELMFDWGQKEVDD